MDFDNFKKRVGLKVQYYRKLKDITQAKLAEIINCDETYISLIENGRTGISMRMIYDISKALEINASKLFDIYD